MQLPKLLPEPDDLGPVFDEFRMSRFTVALAWFATGVIGLLWLFMFIVAISVLCEGSVAMWEVILWSLPLTMLLIGAVWCARLLGRILLQQRENGIVYRDHAHRHVVPYDTIVSSEVVAETRFWHRFKGGVLSQGSYIRHVLNVTLRGTNTTLRIDPWLMRDVGRLQRLHMAIEREREK